MPGLEGPFQLRRNRPQNSSVADAQPGMRSLRRNRFWKAKREVRHWLRLAILGQHEFAHPEICDRRTIGPLVWTKRDGNVSPKLVLLAQVDSLHGAATVSYTHLTLPTIYSV